MRLINATKIKDIDFKEYKGCPCRLLKSKYAGTNYTYGILHVTDAGGVFVLSPRLEGNRTKDNAYTKYGLPFSYQVHAKEYTWPDSSKRCFCFENLDIYVENKEQENEHN